ncbi:Site-specific DNA recombinase [Tranquillimonas rosea]|uniref:Site-specific DNA recombinase n=1 Tax=Tranquillimonas rosea TaxID=641238 RepID=A0A1H9S9E0_9RHOB|nr:recombinase family protein [Tranquillimonas rosea]SER81581.1 Site-specific DNA recombinase [Tranquillimonas rosea]
MKIGYRRVSSEDQNLARQELGETDKVFEEKVSGGSFKNRPALRQMLDFAREGDEVIVFSIDRLARDLRDLQEVIQTLNDKGVAVTFLTERLSFTADADDAFAKLQLQMMGAFAEFERSIIRKRQAEGIAKAKANGVYKGRKPSIDRSEVRRLKDAGFGATAIADAVGASRASVYRVLAERSPR